jgi:PAS domain S-box-containing protein
MNPADKTESVVVGSHADTSRRATLGRLHSTILDSMAEGVTVSDESGTIVYTNAAEDRMFGYERGELAGGPLAAQNGYSEDVHRRVTAQAVAQVQDAGEWKGEWLNRKKDGTLFYTSTQVRAIEEDGIRYWLWIHTSAGRRDEAEFRESNQALHALIHASPLPIVAFNRKGLIQLWNAAAERVFGWTEAEVLDRPLPFIPEEKRAEHQSMRERDLSGENFTAREVRRRRKDGTPVDLSVSTAPMYDSHGQITGIMSVYVDVTEQKRIAEEQQRALELLRRNEAQLTLLVEASGLLLASPQSEQVLRTILELSQKFVRAEAYAVWRKHRDQWRLMVSTGLSDTYERTITTTSANEMQLPDEPFAVEDVYGTPGLATRARFYRAEGIQSILTVPLKLHGEVAGTIVFYYRQRYTFSESERRVAGALGNLAASALSAAEMYERQIELRAIAEASERRASFLAAVGEELVSSLDYEVTLASVAKLAVPDFADWCSVDILQADGRIQRLAVQHIDPAKVEFAYEFARRYPARDDDLSRVVMRTGQPVLLSDIPDSMLVERAENPEHLAMLRALDIKSVICAPMVARDRTMGLVTFVLSGERSSFDAQDLELAIEIARRSAVAIDNARLFREVRESEERFRRLYESNILGITFWNINGDITAANDAFLRVLGMTRQEFDRTGCLRWSELTPEESWQTDELILRECRDSGASGVHEKEFFRRDGTRAVVLVAATFLTSLQTEGVAFVVDITDRKKLNRQFRGVAEAAVAISAAPSVNDVLLIVNHHVRSLVPCRRTEIRLSSEPVAEGAADLVVPLKDRSGNVMGAVRLWAQEPGAFPRTTGPSSCSLRKWLRSPSRTLNSTNRCGSRTMICSAPMRI